MFFFTDGFSHSNHIKMTPHDAKKKKKETPALKTNGWATFIYSHDVWSQDCYRDIPVSNDYLFHDILHDASKIIVDDINIEFKEVHNHVSDLRRFSKRCRQC